MKTCIREERLEMKYTALCNLSEQGILLNVRFGNVVPLVNNDPSTLDFPFKTNRQNQCNLLAHKC